MTYYDFISKMTKLVQNYEKLMEEIKQTKPYDAKYEEKLKNLYYSAWDTRDLINFDINFEKQSDYKFKAYREKETQEVYDKYCQRFENCKSNFEYIKEQMEKQKSYDTGVMSGEEFKQKMLKIKEQLLDIKYAVEREDAYIFNQEDFEFFHTQVQKHIERLNFAVGQYERGYTNGRYHYKTYSDFCIILSNDKKHWKTLQEENEFIAPR